MKSALRTAIITGVASLLFWGFLASIGSLPWTFVIESSAGCAVGCGLAELLCVIFGKAIDNIRKGQ